MRPYYSDASVAIYHGDWREVLSELTPPGAVVTDPPYGIGIVGAGRTVGGTKAGVARTYIPVHDDDKPFDPALVLALGVPTIMWGGNHYADKLPPSSRWLVWDKRDGGASDNFADCELAWTNLGGPARLHRQMWRGMIATTTHADGERFHPTQKPVALMQWCLGFVDPALLILDPFMGSGSTLRAAKDLGRRAVGVDIEERYCELAAQRMGQEVLF